MADQAICSVAVCGKPTRGSSPYCKAHALAAWRHNGDPLGGRQRISRDGTCLVDGCGKPRRSNGMCSMHAERKRLKGDAGQAGPIDKSRGNCTLEGCLRPHYGHGYCVRHYKRWRKYGDPLGGSTPWGAVRRWMDEVAVPYAGDACLVFPYSRNIEGYGKIRIGPKNIGAHVYALTAVAGEKPGPHFECCHECGNGHLGCVNPHHLYWGTRADNVADAKRHGTLWRGGSRPRTS